MLKSKFKPYAIFSIVLTIVLFFGICFFIFLLISTIFFGGHIIPRGTMPIYGIMISILFFLVPLFLIIYSWTLYVFVVSIDKNKKTISFKNPITLQSRLYDLSDFDGFIDTYSVSKSGAYKTIYLIKDKKAEKIISGFYYSNIDELKDSLSPIKYLGFRKDASTLANKTLLKRQIIDD